MQDAIHELLKRKSSGLKGREIAKELNVDKSKVNSFLAHDNSKMFIQDEEYRWFLADQLTIHFSSSRWLSADDFENILNRSESPLETKKEKIFFIVETNTKFLIEPIVRLLALCNQVVESGRALELDIQCKDAESFFDRLGFFGLLDERVSVTRQCELLFARSEIYRENSNSLMELRRIKTIEQGGSPDENIPKHLKNVFVKHAGDMYSTSAFTIISELFGNAEEHSKSDSGGIAVVQFYKSPKRPHIQTVISDNGLGIIGTLRPKLKDLHSSIYKKYPDDTLDDNVGLIFEMLSQGEISQTGEKGRGLGLKRSADAATKFTGTLCIRQDTFELQINISAGILNPNFTVLERKLLKGTHICFDFFITK